MGEALVNGCIEDMVRVRTQPICNAMTKKEHKKLHQDIAHTFRPALHCGPPVNLGEESHGKLKADVLCSLAEFDLVATASEIWAKNTQPANTNPDVAEQSDKKFWATMYLCIVIRFGTSFKTLAEHAQKYTMYMTAYLELLLDLYPGICLTPNQHKALHIDPGLV